jgi:hypothetical protein
LRGNDFGNYQYVDVTACKVEDADGDLATTDDQTPIEGWTVYLSIDGVRQTPGQLTGADGCYTWEDLGPGHSYDVEEDDPAPDWTALTPLTHDFGPASAGESYSFTFVNYENVDVEACKVEDADGDVATTDDQTPIEGWTVYLTIDGVVEDTQLTEADGCYTWENLGPLAAGSYYDVEEDDPAPEWTALTPLSHDCDPLGSGESCSYTFVNYENVDVEACKVEDADGDVATTDDQTPIALWTVYLTIDGVVEDTQLTEADGCYTWENLGPLAAGSYYDVEEDVPIGWTALTATSHDFDPPVSGESYSFTFINSRELGCALTFGYWKNHDWDSKHFDPTWDEIGEETDFFDTGINWNDILDLPPSEGNAYFILAHQYIAAILNSLKDDNPASTAMIAQELADAEALLDYYDTFLNDDGLPYIPADGTVFSSNDRAWAIEIAYTLDMFNNGELPGGPPHCGG